MPRYRYYEFTVEGRGWFPIDMLRYDSCWPARPEDAVAIDNTMTDFTDRKKQRTIKLRSSREPTTGRWSSFMWTVTDTRGFV